MSPIELSWTAKNVTLTLDLSGKECFFCLVFDIIWGMGINLLLLVGVYKDLQTEDLCHPLTGVRWLNQVFLSHSTQFPRKLLRFRFSEISYLGISA